MIPRTSCKECNYLREEHAGIHENEGQAARDDAERWASQEFCDEHKPKPEQRELI